MKKKVLTKLRLLSPELISEKKKKIMSYNKASLDEIRLYNSYFM